MDWIGSTGHNDIGHGLATWGRTERSITVVQLVHSVFKPQGQKGDGLTEIKID